MIPVESSRSVKKAWKQFLKAREDARKARINLIEELAAAHAFGATYEELGAIMKVSRQRVGQIVKGVVK